MSLPLVSRYGADPTLDLEVANKRYVDASGGVAILTYTNHIGVGDNTFCTFATGLGFAGQTQRREIVAVAGTLSLFCVIIQVNRNTIDGGFFEHLFDDVAQSDPLVVDQATGFIQNITANSTFTLGQEINFRYSQGNNTIDLWSFSALMTPT